MPLHCSYYNIFISLCQEFFIIFKKKNYKKDPPSLPPWKTVKTTVGLAGTLKNDLKTAASCETHYKLRKKLLKKKKKAKKMARASYAS